jgi:hypothetical protein
VKTFRIASLLTFALAAGSMTNLTLATDAKVLAEAREQVKDYVHYVRIARYDLAKSFGQAVLDKMAAPFGKVEGDAAIDPAEFAKLIDEAGEAGRFEDSSSRGMRIADIESVSTQLARAYELGKQGTARGATSIDENINLLTGTQRQRLVARERLAEAGEYAMPQLLAALMNQSNPTLRAEVRQLMVDMGRQAARPLQSVLGSLDAGTQETVAGILGDIPMTTSIPYLSQLAASGSTDGARRAATLAISKLTGGGFVGNADVAAQFRAVAEQYLAEAESLTPFPKEPTQTVWAYDAAAGLTGTPVNTAVFHETMAMQTAKLALKANPADKQALATWIAADFQREIQTPAGYAHPMMADRADAMYYASAAGSDVLQSVLARALATGNVAMARKAIETLGKTIGPAQLANNGAGVGALSAALRFPNRLVQTDAALVLASNAGSGSFDGAERVVPILASAVRDAGVKNALVISTDGERANAISQALRTAGYTLLSPASDIAGADAAAASVPGVDLVVTALGPVATGETVKALRASPRFSASPVLAMTDAQGQVDLGRDFDRDPMVRLVRSGVDAQAMTEAVNQLTTATGSTALTADEATARSAKALAALRDVALSGSSAMNVADAAGPLVAALGADKADLRGIGSVLAVINSPDAQRALVDAAMKAEGDNMTALLANAAENARRFGNLLGDSQVRALADLAAKPTAPGATAASTLLGALNVSGDRVVPMILGK